MPQRLPTYGLDALPVNLATASLISLLIGAAVAPRLGMPAWRVALWLAALAIPTAATWTIPDGATGSPPTFSFCRIGQVPRPGMVFSGFPPDVWSNLMLTFATGAAAVLWPPGARRLAALATALFVPVGIEFAQLIPALHRGCQLGDIINNQLGVIAGFVVATGVESILLSWRAATQVGALWHGPRHAQSRGVRRAKGVVRQQSVDALQWFP